MNVLLSFLGLSKFFLLAIAVPVRDDDLYTEMVEAQLDEEFEEQVERTEVRSSGFEDSPGATGRALFGLSDGLFEEFPFLDYVDVFYGTEGGGHMFPGTTVPFGMCKMGVDVLHPHSTDAYSGYHSTGDVCGISMLHESGTGGSPTYGVVSQLPLMASSASDVDTSRQIAFSRSKPDAGHIGYYRVSLSNRVTIEFSSNSRSGLYKYTFPTKHQQHHMSPIVMVNVTQHLHSVKRPWWTQNFEGGYIKVDKSYKSYRGKAYFSGGWSDPGTWSVSFYGVFDKPAKRVRAFHGSKAYNRLRLNLAKSLNSNMGMLFEFEKGTKVLYSHVGVSFSETDGINVARQNLALNYPEENMFDLHWSVRSAAEAWDNEVFSKVTIDESKEDPIIVEKMYNALYGSHLMPSDKSGREAPWPTNEPYYDDWFTLWDTFRCLHPLLNILNTKRSADMTRSLIEIWRKEGYMPDGRSASRSGRTQGGSNADIVLADAFVKGVGEGVDWQDGFSAMQSNADKSPEYILDKAAPDSTNKYGRGALNDWLELGYITRRFSRSVTRTMEYAYNDFALSVVAEGLGYFELAKQYLKRSSNWQNIWNFEATTPEYDYSGFIQPKDSNGNFIEKKYNPLSCFGCYWRDDEYEGKPIEYGWAVPHDIQSLKEFIGPDELFMRRLDDMFDLYGDGIADIGNEPSFLTPYLFNFINAQYRTSETLGYLIDHKFLLGPKGLPGNSDAGAMQAWLWFGLVGFYPIAGTDIYLITSPKITELEIQLEGNGKALIQAHNLYAEDADSEYDYDKAHSSFTRNLYISSVELNGKLINRNWFTHEELFGSNGGLLVFTMTDEPTFWDADGEYPPSRGHFQRDDIERPNRLVD